MRGAIHSVIIRYTGITTPNAEGQASAVVTSSVTVTGRVMIRSGKESDAVGKFAEDINAVIALPVGTPVSAKDQILVSGIDPTLDNLYEVQYVFYGPTNLEAFVRIRAQ